MKSVDMGFGPQGGDSQASGGGEVSQDYADYEGLEEGSGAVLKAGLEDAASALEGLAVTTSVSPKGDGDDEVLTLVACLVGGFVGVVLAVLFLAW